MQLLGGEAGEIFPQIKPRLCTKNRKGAGAGAVGFEFAFLQHEPEQIVILNHDEKS
jgi:hypothetical protein